MEIFVTITISLFVLLFLIRKYNNKDGFYEEYHSNGKLKSQTNWKGKVWRNDTRRVGLYKKFYDSGVLKEEGNYNDNGRKHGEWKSFRESSGLLSFLTVYEDGEEVSNIQDENDKVWIDPKVIGSYTLTNFMEEYKGGKLEMDTRSIFKYGVTQYHVKERDNYDFFKNSSGLIDGLFYTHSQIKSIGSTGSVDGRYTGIIYSTYLDPRELEDWDWYPKGQLKSIYIIKRGYLKEENHWYENGQLKTTGSYNKNQNPHGFWRDYYENGEKGNVTKYDDGYELNVNRP